MSNSIDSTDQTTGAAVTSRATTSNTSVSLINRSSPEGSQTSQHQTSVPQIVQLASSQGSDNDISMAYFAPTRRALPIPTANLPLHGNPHDFQDQHLVPQIVLQPASNQDDDAEISTVVPPPPTRGPPPPPFSSPALLEVPRFSRPPRRCSSTQDGRSSQSRPDFSPRSIPQSLTGPLHPLRMHPPGLTSSATMPATPAIGRPGFHSTASSTYPNLPSTHPTPARPPTLYTDEVKDAVGRMLAANAALGPEETDAPAQETEPTTTERPSLGRRLLRKISMSNFPAHRLFPSRNKPKDAAAGGPQPPLTIRHIITGSTTTPLLPLSEASEQAELVPEDQLRLNEAGNVLKREKALRVLGDGPKLPSGLPTEARDASCSDESLAAAAHNPFASERVLTSALDSCLPGEPEGSSTPPRPGPVPASSSFTFGCPPPPGRDSPITTTANTTTTPSPSFFPPPSPIHKHQPSPNFPPFDTPHHHPLGPRHSGSSHDGARHILGTVSSDSTGAIPGVVVSGPSRVPPPPPHHQQQQQVPDAGPRRKRHPALPREDLERLEREFIVRFPGVVGCGGGGGGGGGSGLLPFGEGMSGPFGGVGGGLVGGAEEEGDEEEGKDGVRQPPPGFF